MASLAVTGSELVITGGTVFRVKQVERVRANMSRLAVEENLGYKGTADQLTQMGFLGREGRPFASFTLQRVLVNEALAGVLVYGKKPRKGNPQQELVRFPGSFRRFCLRRSGSVCKSVSVSVGSLLGGGPTPANIC